MNLPALCIRFVHKLLKANIIGPKTAVALTERIVCLSLRKISR